MAQARKATRARPWLHTLDYGDSGSGKSTFASTFPKPMIVFHFDPLGKELPYSKRGDVSPIALLDDGTPLQLVECPDGLIQIEHYIDEDPEHPEAYHRFRARMAIFRKDYAEWQTAVIDSVTFMELAARKQSQYVLKPNVKEPRQWFADSTEALEEMLMLSFGSFHLNVVVCAHIDEDKDEVNGIFVRNPAAPGRLRKRSPAGFSEVYRSFVTDDEKRRGEKVYLLQTRADRMYNASSQIEAADPSWPDYEALWENWK